jgi:type VI secretion system protein ImpK
VQPAEREQALLVRQFRAFYAELVRLKRQVQREGSVPAGNGRWTEAADEAQAGTATAVQQQLVARLNEQAQVVRRAGGEALQHRFRKVEYAMVALADEVFLNVDWEGRADWYNHLLESRRFDSQNAGVQVFTRIDELLADASAEPDVPIVYLYLLVLGFEGQYRDAPDKSPLDDYRRRLYKHIQRQHGATLDEDAALSAAAYRHTLDQGEVQLLPNLRWWTGSLLATGVLYLVVSTGLWWWYTDDLAELAQQILSAP